MSLVRRYSSSEFFIHEIPGRECEAAPSWLIGRRTDALRQQQLTPFSSQCLLAKGDRGAHWQGWGCQSEHEAGQDVHELRPCWHALVLCVCCTVEHQHRSVVSGERARSHPNDRGSGLPLRPHSGYCHRHRPLHRIFHGAFGQLYKQVPTDDLSRSPLSRCFNDACRSGRC